MGKVALVTGGAGLIGSHLVDLLLQKGHSVRILDNLDPQTHPHGVPPWIPKEAELIVGDVRDKDVLKRSIQGVDWIFHQAAFGGFTSDWSHYIDVNGTGTARIFEVIRNEGFPVEKIVVASSQAIYGEGLYTSSSEELYYPELRPLQQLERREWEFKDPRRPDATLAPRLTPENAPLRGLTPYAVSKLCEERLALHLGKELNIPVVALRYAVTYGPRQSLFNPYTGIVSIFATQLLNGQNPIIHEDGLQTRDFLYAEDNARANLFVMESDSAWEAFNVGTGIPSTVLSFYDTLADALGKPKAPPTIRGTFRLGDVRHFAHDVTKLSALGWRSSTSLRQGLERYSEWILSIAKVDNPFADAYAKLLRLNVVRIAE